MIIVSKDRESIINMEQVTSIHIGADGCTLKVDFVNGKGCQIGRYGSEKECQVVIAAIAKNIEKAGSSFMPDDDEVRVGMGLEKQKHRHATGKKPKGHGGS